MKREMCDKALAAHASWKAKFRKFLAGELGLDLAVAEKHNGCEFGRWLEGEGRGHLSPQEHAAIHSAHAAFHKAVGGVIRAKQAGDTRSAVAALAVDGAFSKASVALTQLVTKARDAA